MKISIVCQWILWVVFASCYGVTAFARDQAPLQDEIDEDAEYVEAGFLKKVQKLNAKKLSDLAELDPFSDVSVIQRRFMPKTGRVNLGLSATSILSNEFFLNVGLSGNFTYHFLEKHGLELGGFYVYEFLRGINKNFNEVVGITASTNAFTSNIGALFSYKWIPIYGKMALFDDKMSAFDFFFQLGGGILRGKIRGTSEWAPTGIFKLGQIFAATRDFAIMWDGSVFLTYVAGGLEHEIVFSIGVSWYFPSAGQR